MSVYQEKNHLIEKQPKTITSHDSFQSPTCGLRRVRAKSQSLAPESGRAARSGPLIWKNTNGDGTNGDGTSSDLRSQRAHSKKLLLSRHGPDEPKTKKVTSPFVPSPFVSFGLITEACEIQVGGTDRRASYQSSHLPS
jgi:hypothetical protein